MDGIARSSALVAITLASVMACAHHQSAPPQSSEAEPAQNPSPNPSPNASSNPAPNPTPGARSEAERTHVLEAQWKEVEVKAKKDGDAVVSAIKLVQPKIRIFHATPPPEKTPTDHDEKQAPPVQPDEAVDLNELLHKITPLDVDHIDILDGQVAFVDTGRQERPELWMHDLQVSVENLTNRVRLTEGRPILLTASATIARSGAASLLVTADPFEKGLTFSGRAAIVGLQTAELFRFMEPATKLHAPEGTIDLFVEFECRNGQLTGGVKPVLKNVKVRPADEGFFTKLKAWVADLAVKVFSDRIENRNAVATVIPIKGTLTGPDVQLWPSIFGVLRNAFVEGLTSGYAHLPPP
jgi:hypothetical protein